MAEVDPAPLPATTPAQQDDALGKLRDMVPEAFQDGVLDPDALLAHLGVVPVPEGREAPYSFLWSGLTRARVEATSPTTATLRPDPDASVEWDDTGNVAIEGDNLQVLKTLLNGYRGRFKLIYIDPPYNTGSTFTYSDKFAIPEAEWLQQTGQVDKQGNALTSKIENGGRKHAPWLTMMLPRLIVARHLLRRDGAIIAAIDDNEVHHLRMLMDAVFGEVNLVGSFVWEGGRKNDARFVSVGHDYMLVYARDRAHLTSRDVRWNVRKRGLEPVYAKEKELREQHGDDYVAVATDLRAWFDALKLDDASRAHRHYRRVDARGIYYPDNMSSPNYRKNLKYDFKGYTPPAKGWRYELDTMLRLDAEDRIEYPTDEDGRLALKRYLHENETQVLASVFYRDRRAAARGLEELMGAEVFDFPKDTTILAQLLEALTADDDLVLDFFAGTGSMGHAVMQQNADDEQQRRFVMVQAPEETTEGEEAYDAGYRTISELMFERLRRAAAKIAVGDVGFRAFRLAESNLREEPPIVTDGSLDGEAYIQQALAIHGAPTIREGSDPADVLWEVLLKGTRFDLSARSEPDEVAGLAFTRVSQRDDDGGSATVICLADEISLEQFEALALAQTDTLICLKDAMDDGTAVTVGQRCKLLVIERVRSEVSLEEQPHQLKATAAIVDLFDGALMPPEDFVGATEAAGARGHRGYRLDLEHLLANVRVVQTRESVSEDEELKFVSEDDLLGTPTAFPNFAVEMETGTGKTYVYIRTCLQLAQEYGLRKFVIVVHSAAIRAGVLKTFDQTADHFADTFPDLAYGWGAMTDNSGLDDFIDPSDAVRFLVVMIQSFDKPDTNVVYRGPEAMSLWGESQTRMATLSGTQPVLVIDEPQNMETDKRRRALATLNPLFALRYSATHREPYNLVHRLDARAAHAKGLVKSITVKGVAAGRDASQAFVGLMGTSARGKSVKATLRVNMPDADSIAVKQADLVVVAGDDLEEETGLSAYEGWIVEEIERDPERVIFENGEVIDLYAETETDRQALWRDQIYQTIRVHLERQRELDHQGVPVKVLSLFFVEAVADYEGDEAVLPKLFDDAYAEVASKFHKDETLPDAQKVRTAYFARNKKGEAKDTGPGHSDRKEIEAQAFDLIIANKEKILVRSEPAAFIFSHSALREGWDNPNVFQTCFLRHVRSPVERRQQIGRGLRLAVQESGERLKDRDLNRLTVVVDEAFSEFRDALNKEYEVTTGKGRDKKTTSDSPEITNLDGEVQVRRRPEQFESERFAELWKRIRYRARYRVEFDADKLVTAVLDSAEIKELKRVRTTYNRITSGRLKFDAAGKISTSDGQVSEGKGSDISRVGPLPDPVRLVEDRLQSATIPLNLTRSTIARIVEGAPHKDRAVRQPEQWCAILARAIQDVAIEHMVEGIVYEPVPESEWWDANVVFADPVVAYDKPEPDPGAPWSGVIASAPDGPNLYTHVVHDSRVERNFGIQLDENDDVQLFCKLPRRFRIDTPVGTYSPDFAIVVDHDGSERLYLVRETKATLDLKDLEWDERLKIRFAGSHFAAAPVPAVHFDHTTDAAGLRPPDPSE